MEYVKACFASKLLVAQSLTDPPYLITLDDDEEWDNDCAVLSRAECGELRIVPYVLLPGNKKRRAGVEEGVERGDFIPVLAYPLQNDKIQ